MPDSDLEFVKSLAPDTGFLADYIAYATQLTDAPPIFHLACGLSALSTSIGSSVTFAGGGRSENWPNLYILLIAPSGIYRKSTAIDIASDLLRHAEPALLLSQDWTREELVRQLAKEPTKLLRSPEFSFLLANMSKSYMEGSKEFLTEIYDPIPQYRRDLRGVGGKGERVNVVKPALSILGATTIDWLMERITQADFRGGFMARFLLFPAHRKSSWRSFLHDDTPELRDMQHYLIDSLKAFSKMQGSVHTATFHGVAKVFRDLNQSWEQKVEMGQAPAELTGLYARLGAHAAKIAVLYQVDIDGPAKSVYQVGSVAASKALYLIGWLVGQWNTLCEQGLVFDKYERKMQSTLELVRKGGGQADYRDALRQSHEPGDNFEKQVRTLMARGELEIITEKRAGQTVRILHSLNGLHPMPDDMAKEA